MGACADDPITTSFILNNYWPATGNPALYLTNLKNYPLIEASVGDHQDPIIFQTTELPEASLTPKQYPQITGRIIT